MHVLQTFIFLCFEKRKPNKARYSLSKAALNLITKLRKEKINKNYKKLLSCLNHQLTLDRNSRLFFRISQSESQ